MPASGPQPIDTAPRSDKLIFVADDTGWIAKAFWHRSKLDPENGMWALPLPDGATPTGIEFKPTRWSDNPEDFLDD